MNQIYILTKLFNVHDRINSLYLCNTIEKWIREKKISGFDNCFLPYRDSNKKLENKANQTKEIFELDCQNIRNSKILIGYIDGPIYDSGIGFEIGFAYILGKPIILLTSDYYFVLNNECYSSISPLIESMASVIHVPDAFYSGNSYGAYQRKIKNEMNKKLLSVLSNFNYNDHKKKQVVDQKTKHNILVDYSFNETYSSRIVLDKLLETISNSDYTYHVIDKNEINSIHSLINLVINSNSVILYSDGGFDHSIDSSVLQGITYCLGKNIYLLSSSQMKLFQNESFIMQKNPMIEHSSHIIKDLNEFLILLRGDKNNL